MFKQVILVMVVSIAAIFFKSQLTYVLHYLLVLHNALAYGLASIFSNSPTGQMIQAIVALIVIPIIITGIMALAYWLVKRSEMPHLTAIVWFIWAVLLAAILA